MSKTTNFWPTDLGKRSHELFLAALIYQTQGLYQQHRAFTYLCAGHQSSLHPVQFPHLEPLYYPLDGIVLHNESSTLAYRTGLEARFICLPILLTETSNSKSLIIESDCTDDSFAWLVHLSEKSWKVYLQRLQR